MKLPTPLLAVAALVAAPVAIFATESVAASEASPAARPVYVGVELMPVDAPTRTLFKLPETGGLLVAGVAPGSPADGALGQGDILLKLDDQLLINREQIRALVRSKKSGAPAVFTVARGGRTETVTVKLAESPAPAFGRVFTPPDLPGFQEGRAEALLKRLHERTKGMLDDSGVDESVFDRAMKDATVSLGDAGEDVAVDLGGASGLSVVTSRVVSTPEGKVVVTSRDGQKSVVVKDKDGKTLVSGKLDDALRAKLPAWAKAALDGKAPETGATSTKTTMSLGASA